MKLGHKGHLNTRNKFPKRFFLNPKISLPILDKLKKPRFWWNREKSAKLKGLDVTFLIFTVVKSLYSTVHHLV
jgi:hypothetical protein